MPGDILVRFFILFLLSGVAAAETTQEWLARMSHAHRELSYHGIVTLQVDDQLSSYKLVHQVIDGNEFEMLKPMDSADAELVRTGHSIHCIHTAEALLRDNADNKGLARHYDLKLAKSTRVAGRDAALLTVWSRDAFRLNYRIAIDAETGVPLKMEVLDKNNLILERFQFVLFELGVEKMSANTDSVKEVTHQESVGSADREKVMASMAWRPTWIPDGFSLAQFAESEPQALTFTDGMSSFSVFIEAIGRTSTAPKGGAMRSGATVSYTYLLPDSRHVATVMGEVPLITAEQVAKSVTVGAQ